MTCKLTHNIDTALSFNESEQEKRKRLAKKKRTERREKIRRLKNG